MAGLYSYERVNLLHEAYRYAQDWALFTAPLDAVSWIETVHARPDAPGVDEICLKFGLSEHNARALAEAVVGRSMAEVELTEGDEADLVSGVSGGLSKAFDLWKSDQAG